MRKDALQEISNSIIINAITDDFAISKSAGLFESLGLDSAASRIKDAVASRIGGMDSTDDILDNISDMLISGTLFKVHPVLGVGYAMAEALGVDVKGIVSSAIDAIRGKGGSISEGEFNSVVKSAMEDPKFLIKEAQSRYRTSPSVPFFGGWVGQRSRYYKPNVITRVFGDLFRSGRRMKASWLARGIIIWTLKTALLGGGLLAASSALIGAGKDFKESFPESGAQPEEGSGSAYTPSDKESKPQPKNWKKILLQTAPGFKEQKHGNNDEEIWIVDLTPFGNIENMLLAWTSNIYPELGKLRSIIPNFPSFRSTVGVLRSNHSPKTPNALVIPTQFNSRKQIVDRFASDVADHAAQQISEQIG